MADNLGTLWFGADIDLAQLRQKIQQQNQSILDALKMNYDPKSYQDMVNSLRTALNSETFQIKISTDAQSVAQNVRQQLNNATSGVGGSNLAGLTGINGMTRDILNQREAVRDTRAEVDALREAWQRASAQYGRTSMQARAAQSAYDRARRDLRESKYELSGLNIERGRAQLAQKVLNEQMKQGSAAAKQMSSDHMRLNTTLAGGIHISTQLGSALSSLFAIHAAKQFLDNVIEIGGQLEKQRISMGAIIGDTARANELFEQIKDLAIKSPFGVVELDQYSKQLAAYGIEQSKLFDMTKRLADISAGAGQDIGRLALALGHVKSATYLTGITLRQFSMNNIPMLKMLADYYTEVEKRAVTTAEVQKRISNRQVSYEDVEEQIRRMTDEGGQFFNMQEKISESLSAKFKNLKDSFDIMYGEIAESSLGDFLKGIASILTSMSRNWETFAYLLGGAAATLGIFKISLLPVNSALAQFGKETVLTSTRLNAQRIAMGMSTAETKALSAATVDVMVKQGLLSRQQLLTAVATKKLTVAQAELAAANFNVTKGELLQIASMGRWGLAMRTLTVGVRSLGVALKGLMFNPFTIALTAITAAVELFMHFKNKTDETKQSVKDLVNIANEGFENIQDVLKKFPEKTLDGATMSGGIKEITEALKNYAPNANAILEEANAINDLAARYAFLRGELESTKNAYADLEKTADYVVSANNATGNIINDTFTEQVDDYLDDLRNVRKAEQEFLYHRIAINEALDKIAKGVPEFAKGRYDEEGNLKGLKEQIELLKNIQIPNFGSAFTAFTQSLAASNSAASKALNEWSVALSDADKRMRDEVMPDLIKFAQKLDDSYKGTTGWGENWKQNGDHVKTAILAVTKELEKIPDMTDAVKNDLLDKIFNEQWHLNIKFTTEEAEEELTGWQKEMQDYFDENHIYIRLSMSSTREDVIKQIEAERKKAQEIADNAGKVLIGIGFKLDKLPTNLPSPLATPWNQDALQVYQQQTDYINKLNAGIDRYNLNVSNKAADKARKAAETATNKAEREAEKKAREKTKQEEARLKIEEELAKQRLELQDAIADAEVAAIENNAERERRQRKVEFEKQKRQLDKQVEEWKRKSFELAKKEHEANPKNKTISFYDTPVGKDGWQAQKLTPEQEGIYAAQEEARLANMKRYIKEESDARIQALRDYIKEYGTIDQKRAAIEEEYKKKIQEAGTIGEKLTLQAKMEVDLSALDSKKIADTLNLEDIFNDLGVQSIEKMKSMRDALREQLSNNNLGFEEYKVIAEQIDKITEAIVEKENRENEILGIRIPGETTVKRLKEEQAEAMKNALAAQQALNKAQLEVKWKKENVKNLLSSNGINYEGEITAANSEKILKAIVNPELRAKVEKALLALGKAETNATNATKKKEKADSKATTVTDKLSDALSNTRDRVGEFADSLQQAMTNLNSLPDLANSLGIGFGKDAQQGLDGINDAMGAMQDYASGNYIGAAAKGISAVKNLGQAVGIFGGADNSAEMLKIQQDARGQLEQINGTVERISEKMEKSYGASAIKSYEELTKYLQAREQYYNKGMQAAGNSNYGGGNIEWYHRNKNGGEGANGYVARLKQYFGLNFEGTAWQDFFEFISKLENGGGAKIMDAIRNSEELQDIWYEMTRKDSYDEGAIAQWAIDWADAAEDVRAAQESLYKQLTSTTAADVFDDFLEALNDFANGAEDAFDSVAENWQKMMNRMVINNLIATDLQNWINDVKDENDNLISKGWYTRLAELQEEYSRGEIEYEEYIRRRTELMEEYAEKQKEYTGKIGEYTEMGLIVPLDEANEKLKDIFDNIESSFKSLISETEPDMEEWGKNMKNSIIENLIEVMVFGEEFKDWMKTLTEDFNKIWEQYEAGDIDADQLAAALAGLESEIDAKGDSIAEKIKALKETLGYAFDSDEITTSFGDLKDKFMSALTDMEKGAENFKKTLNELLIKDLIEKEVFEVPITVKIDGEDKVFDNFQKYQEDWNKRYSEIYNNAELSAEERERLLQALVDELVAQQEITAKAAEDLTKRLKEVTQDETFKNLSDNWVSALMDMSKTAEDWAKDIGKMMAEKIIKEMVVPTLLQPLLTNLQDVFNGVMAKAVTKDGDGKAVYNWDAIFGSNELQDAINALTEAYPEAQELVKKIMELFGLDTSNYKYSGFSNLGDSILESLKSSEGSLENWAKSMGQQMAEDMAKAYIDSHYGETIEALNKDWQEALEHGNTDLMKSIEDQLSALYGRMADDPELQRLIDKFRELAENPFKDMASDFASSLMDMEQSAEDFANNIAKSLTQEMITKVIKDQYQSQIDALGEQWKAALEAGDSAAIERIRQQLEALYEKMGESVKPLLDAIKDIGKETDTTFTGMKDSWVSALMDMEGTAEDFAQTVGRTMAQKIITELVAPTYIEPILKRMQDAYNLAIAESGATFGSVLKKMTPFLSEIEGIYNEIQPIIQEIFGTIGIVADSVEEAAEEVEYALGDMKSNFVSALMDMTNSAEDFSKDISKIMAQTFIEKFVLGEQFDRQMEYWQQQYESIIGSGMSEDERKRQLKALRDTIVAAKEGYVNEAMAIQELFGLTTEDNQTATMNMADKITYDQADQLLGINLAQELTLEQILATLQGKDIVSVGGSGMSWQSMSGAQNDEQGKLINATLTNFAQMTQQNHDNILTQVAMANSHLQMIRDYSKKICDQVELHMESMDDKLSHLRNW